MGDEEDALLHIRIGSLSGAFIEVELQPQLTVAALKPQVAERWHVPPSCQRLVLGTAELDDLTPLGSLSGPDQGGRGQGVIELTMISSSETLLQQLSSSDLDHRLEALRSLAQWPLAGGLDAVPALMTSMEDPDTEARRWALEALTHRRTLASWADEESTVMDKVIQLQGNADEGLRCIAVEALGKLGSASSAEVLEAIYEGLEDDSQVVRASAARSLAALNGQQPALALLAERAEHQQALVRLRALEALASLGGRDALATAAVRRGLGDSELEVRLTALRALPEVTERNDPTLLPALSAALEDQEPRVQLAAADGLAALGRQEATAAAVPRLRHTGAHVRRAALQLLGRAKAIAGQDEQEEQDEDRQMLSLLRPRLRDTEASVRAAAVELLPRLVPRGDSQALTALRPRLADTEAEVREVAVLAVGTLMEAGDRRTLSSMIERLEDGDAAVVRAAKAVLRRALGQLAEQGGEACMRTLGSHLRHRDMEVRALAVEAFAQAAAGDESAVTTACAALEHNDRDVRRAAVNAAISVAARAREATVAAVSSRLSHTDPEVRWAAVDVLGKICTVDDEATVAALNERRSDEDGAVRQAAVEALVSVLGVVDDLAVTAVRGAFFGDPDDKVRAATLGLLQLQTRALRMRGAENRKVAGLGALPTHHGLMGTTGSREGTEQCTAALAAGLPQELDWQTLIGQVFTPAQQAVLLLTSEAAAPVPPGQPRRKVVDCFRAGTTGAPAKEVFDPQTLHGRIGLVSQKGKKAAPNQDSAFYLEFLDGDGALVWMTCVMDGHGPLGHEMSRLVMQWLPILVLRDPMMAKDNGQVVPSDPQTVFDGITAAFAKMGTLMRRASAGSVEKELSGTTCVFALCARGLVHTANVGDSRAVLGQLQDREGASAFSLGLDVRPLTRDHKPEDQEERLRIEGMGGVVERQRVYIQKWPYVGLNLSRSFGDSMMHSVGVTHTPDVATAFLDGAGQFLVLASDGVWEFITSQDAAESVGTHLKDSAQRSANQKRQSQVEPASPAQGAALRLLSRASDAWRRETDEMDDITVVIVCIQASQHKAVAAAPGTSSPSKAAVLAERAGAPAAQDSRSPQGAFPGSATVASPLKAADGVRPAEGACPVEEVAPLSTASPAPVGKTPSAVPVTAPRESPVTVGGAATSGPSPGQEASPTQETCLAGASSPAAQLLEGSSPAGSCPVQDSSPAGSSPARETGVAERSSPALETGPIDDSCPVLLSPTAVAAAENSNPAEDNPPALPAGSLEETSPALLAALTEDSQDSHPAEETSPACRAEDGNPALLTPDSPAQLAAHAEDSSPALFTPPADDSCPAQETRPVESSSDSSPAQQAGHDICSDNPAETETAPAEAKAEALGEAEAEGEAEAGSPTCEASPAEGGCLTQEPSLAEGDGPTGEAAPAEHGHLTQEASLLDADVPAQEASAVLEEPSLAEGDVPTREAATSLLDADVPAQEAAAVMEEPRFADCDVPTREAAPAEHSHVTQETSLLDADVPAQEAAAVMEEPSLAEGDVPTREAAEAAPAEHSHVTQETSLLDTDVPAQEAAAVLEEPSLAEGDVPTREAAPAEHSHLTQETSLLDADVPAQEAAAVMEEPSLAEGDVPTREPAEAAPAEHSHVTQETSLLDADVPAHEAAAVMEEPSLAEGDIPTREAAPAEHGHLTQETSLLDADVPAQEAAAVVEEPSLAEGDVPTREAAEAAPAEHSHVTQETSLLDTDVPAQEAAAVLEEPSLAEGDVPTREAAPAEHSHVAQETSLLDADVPAQEAAAVMEEPRLAEGDVPTREAAPGEHSLKTSALDADVPAQEAPAAVEEPGLAEGDGPAREAAPAEHSHLTQETSPLDVHVPAQEAAAVVEETSTTDDSCRAPVTLPREDSCPEQVVSCPGEESHPVEETCQS